MNSPNCFENLEKEFPNAVISVSEPYGLLTIEVKKDNLKAVIGLLKIKFRVWIS